MTTPPTPLPDTPTPPKALFPCAHCSDQYTWPAEDIFWSPKASLWVCLECWDLEEHGDDRSINLGRLLKEKHGDLERECAALRESKWQPIESAPKDGTEIIVWREDAGVFTAAFKDSFQEGDAWNDPTGDPCWFTASGEDLTGDLPVLWQPLPEPPAARRALGKEGE